MKIISKSANDTINIGKVIARNLRKGDIICLFGELGSGKTVLTKGIASGLGIKRRIVSSPSFVLIRQYSTAKIPLYHFDLYRLKAIEDILTLGYEEYFYGDGITLVEWAERLKCLLPKEYLRIKLYIKSDSERLLQISAFGKHYRELLGKIYEDIRH
ncbi:MAG: tRNA (adenosine(37)-N6)-threonylcarbamoyltransferase complex ATPase subunit type 1 TsaE [Candidatus Omnitrophota bacterium]|nr:tRNA (adenosine(37)-N6)-threonylcarbamoyltransferase complex ATPase subunit type 1 TsaE [Candidatus Omnitrophota bacterium]